MAMLDASIERILVSHQEICEASKRLGEALAEQFKDSTPLYVGVLKGSIPFMAELIKHVDSHLETEFMVVSSYHGTTASSGRVKIEKDMDTDVAGRDVVIVEDIIDTGRTLKALRALFLHRKAKSVTIVTMLDKPDGRIVDIDADMVGFTIPNEFVVGFGLDYEGKYRNLPYVGILKEDVYTN